MNFPIKLTWSSAERFVGEKITKMILILFLVYLTDFCLGEYDEKNYETLTFNVALPSKNTYDESGIVSGDYRWYKNSSSKRKLKGKGSDGWFW